MKTLIIRFSSFGDIVQAMSVLDDLSRDHKEIHWATHERFAPLVALHPGVRRVWTLKDGFRPLARSLREERFDLIYDAHSSTRSRLLCPLVRGKKVIRRSKERLKRHLLFKWRMNLFPTPFRGMISYRAPLNLPETFSPQKWNFPERADLPEGGVVLCPGGAWPMKLWPLAHWKELAKLLAPRPLTILGGPQDLFCQEIAQVDPLRNTNLAGKLSLVESCQVIARASLVISADTGLIHVADLLGVPGLSLMGPSAFGFPTLPNIKALGADLPCRPCSKDGRGKCSRDIWQECMVRITPEQVAGSAAQIAPTR